MRSLYDTEMGKGMQRYQEEYIENLKDIAALAAHVKPKDGSFAAYQRELTARRQYVESRAARNMELLKTKLFPLLDHLPEAEQIGRATRLNSSHQD